MRSRPRWRRPPRRTSSGYAVPMSRTGWPTPASTGSPGSWRPRPSGTRSASEPPVPAQVIVVAGPSGAGKSVLCRRLCAERGLAWVNLDDFNKDGDDPTLPVARLPGGAPIVDWDDPRSWHRDLAVEALTRLCREGAVEVPVYDIASDGRVGERTVRLGDAAYVLAEGIFADHVVQPCREQGLLAAAVCVRNPPLLTFW